MSFSPRIVALENIWNQAQLNHDATAMGSMLHPEFVFTDFDGTVMAKPQFLASIRDISNTVISEVSDDMKVHRFGDTVVVTGSTHEKGKQKGKAYQHDGRFTDTWIKHDSEWICVASHLGLSLQPCDDRQPQGTTPLTRRFRRGLSSDKKRT